MDTPAKEWCKQILKSKQLRPGADQIPETISQFQNSPYVDILREGIQKGIDLANKNADFRAARVQKFFVLPNEFSVAGGEFGPTLKVKRFTILNKYKDEIETMYPRDSVPTSLGLL